MEAKIKPVYFDNEFGKKEKVAVQEFKKIKNPELRLRNVANVALNHYEDHGEEVALNYILNNVPPEDEEDFRNVIEEIAKGRGMWVTH